MALDDIIDELDKSPHKKRMAKFSWLGKKIKKGVCITTIWSMICGGLWFAYNLDENKARFKFEQKPQEVTQYSIYGNERTRRNRNQIFFDDKKVFKDTKRFFKDTNTHWKNIYESTNRDMLAFSANPIDVKEALDTNKYEAISGLKLSINDMLSDSRNPDIFMLSKNGTTFKILTNTPERESISGWRKDDSHLIVNHFDKKTGFQKKGINIESGSIEDYLTKEGIVLNFLKLYGSILGMGLGGIMAYDAIRRKHKDVPLLSKPLASTINHTNLTTAINVIAPAAAYYSIREHIYNMPSVDVSQAFIDTYASISLGAIAYLSDYAMRTFGKVKPPYIKNVLKFMRIVPRAFNTNHSETIHVLNEIKGVMKDPEIMDAEFATYYFRGGEDAKAMDSLSNIYHQKLLLNRHREYTTFDKYIATPLINVGATVYKLFNPESMSAHDELFWHSIRNKDYLKTFSLWESMLNRTSDDKKKSMELNCLYGIFLNAFTMSLNDDPDKEEAIELYRLKNSLEKELGDSGQFSHLLHKKTTAQWRKTIDMILQDTEARPRDLGESANKVYVIDNNEYLEQTLVFKESEDRPLDAEYEFNLKMQPIIEGLAKTPVPLIYFQKNGRHYYVMQREKGRILTDIVRDGEDIGEIYDNIINVMAKVHAEFPCENIDLYEYRNKIERKDLPDGIKSALQPIVSILENTKTYGINHDGWTDNWMIGESGDIIILDTENLGVIPVAQDVANLLNYVPHPEGFDTRMDLVEKYIEKYNSYSENKITDKQQFIKEYCAAVVYKGISNTQNIRSNLFSIYHDGLVDEVVEMAQYMKENNMLTDEQYDMLNKSESLKIS